MMQAMNTGHEGSLTTVHANSPRDALYRLETMILMAESNLVEWAVNRQIASAIDVIIQVNRMSDGVRRLSHMSELTGMEGEVVAMHDIVLFHQRGISQDGKVIGDFKFTGVRPRFIDKLKIGGFLNGLSLPMFEGVI